MRLTSLIGNSQRLDGGAMFGNAPRTLWERWIQPDPQNRIPLACRCLLVQTDDGKKVLLETGIGAFFSPEMKDRFGVVESQHVLIESLAAAGVKPEDIDVIVLSHLHFDHAGGLLTEWHANTPLALAFPNAHYLVSATHLERARTPHPRDRASFIPELLPLLEASGRLVVLPAGTSTHALVGPKFRFHYSEGHTPGLLLTELLLDDGPMLFAADLIPGVPWVHTAITMGYDRFPELLISEKQTLLEHLLQTKGSLFFTHDAQTATAKVSRDAKGKFGIEQAQAQLVGAEL